MENTMNSTQIPTATSSRNINDKMNLWLSHIEAQATSGLSKKAYCDAQAISSDNFYYWSKKLSNTNPQKQFIAVKIDATQRIQESTTLCTLKLNNGCSLQFHDQQALLLLLERVY